MSAPTTRPPESTPRGNGVQAPAKAQSKANVVAPQQMTGAQSVVRSLEEIGVEVIFGILLAWLGAGEAPRGSVLVGGAIVIGALVGNEWLGWRQRT